MKNKFTLRIGQWITPPHLRKLKTDIVHCALCIVNRASITLLLVMLMSVNLMAGVTDLSESLDLTTKAAGSSAYNGSTTYGDWTIVNGANNNKGWTYFKMGGKSATISSSNPCYIYYSANSGVSSQVDSITVSIPVGSLSKSGMSVNSWGVYVYSDKAMTTQVDYVAGGTITNSAATFGFKPSAGKTWGKGYYYKVSWNLANTTTTNGIVCVDKITLHEINDAPAPKDVTITADDELNLSCAQDEGTINVTYGADVDEKDIALYADKDCKNEFSGDWFIADFDASGNVDYLVSANTATAREVYIQIYVLANDGETENTKVIKVTQEEYKEPTGTFNKFTGDNLKEGDYVICSSTDAMNNTTKDGPRIGYQTITVSNNNIENPDEAVIWHISADPNNAGYWLMYNEAAKKYAAFTSSDGKGTLLDAVTDYARWQSSKTTGKETYEFTNKGKTSKYLRKNGTYGFASYGTSTGGALTLYKKYVEPAKNKVTLDTEIEHGTINATPASGTLESVEEDVVVTLTNTPATGYKLDAYDVYKTGEPATKVTIENGKFTMPAYAVTVSATFSLSIETPVLSEAAGDKNDAINVKVSNYNGDYSYYYTLDGTDPTNASTLYVDADGIAINASCTLKVIAYKSDVTSPVASATYNLPLMTMGAIFAAATTAGKTPKDVRVKFTDCVITGVKNNNAYLTDNDGKGLIIFQSSHGFVVNDKLNGAVNVKVQLYNGSAELTELTSSTTGLTVTKDGSVTPITNIGIADLTGVNTGAVLSYTNLTSNGTVFSDGTNTLTPYNTFITLPSFENGDKYNVTGVYIQYSNTKEIAPRTLADLQKIEATKYAINLATVEHGTIATDPETEAADGVKVTLSATPATGYMLGEWSVVDEDSNPVEVVNNQFTMPAKAVTVSATFVELPIWATTYTSNVTVGTDKVKLAEAYQPADYPTDGYDAKKDGTSSKAASISIKVPAKTTGLHYHLFAWNGEGGKTVTIKKGEETLKTFENVADASISGNSPYTLQNNPVDAYGYVALEGITEETTITFSTTSGNQRIVLFGVNAIQPAAITIDPTSKDFGEVKQGFNAEQVFTLAPNAFATGEITAEIEGEGFSASAVENNQVTITFAPTEIKDYSATLIIKHDGEQMCTAALSGKGISATQPEIIVSTEEIDFGKVKQDASIADKTVTVTLNYLDAATASISEGAFTINKTNLVAGENTITISASASSMGAKNATITITGEDATTKTIAVKMDVTSKWAGEYTSNVKVGSDKVIISEEEYEAHKAGGSKTQGLTTITVPEGAHTLHFHAAGWNSESVTLKVSNGTTELTSKNLFADAGFKGNGPSYTLEGENYDSDQYFYVEFDALEAETDFTFEATSGNRFVLYGVNQEGGVLPVLDHITIGGEATKLNYNTTDAFDPVGLTVSAVYTLKGVEQTPVDVTEKVDWTFDPATFNTVGEDLSVTATASFTDGEVTKTADKVITGISVEEATPSISASKVNIEFGEVIQGATVEPIQSKITLKYIDEVSVTLSETTAFEIDKTSMTETGYLTISAVTTAEVGEYTATVTIKDLASETNKVLNLSITIKEAPHPAIYSLVTDASTLKAGDVIVMAATYSGNTYVNGALSGDLLTCVDATITNGKLTAIGACEFTLGGEAGAWTLTSTDGTLGATAAKKLTYDNTKDNFVGTWTISIDGDNNATIAPNAEGYGRFMYNHNNGGNRFLTYTSNTSASMLLPQIYRLGVDGETNASTLDDHADVTVNEGGNLLIDAPKTLGDIVVAVGGKVTISGTATLTVNNFVIKSSMGGGQSGQVIGVTSTNFVVDGEAYYDVTMDKCVEGSTIADQWHAFAVPFNVDAINGIYDLDDNKLTNEVNYAIMDYHGDVRAKGQYGWKKFRGIMTPGTFYLMTVDGLRTTYRMKMNGGFSASSTTISVQQYAKSGAGQTTDAGWNGIANNQLSYSSVNANVQVLNPVSYTYEVMTASSTNFTVGTPFFYQVNGDEEDSKIKLADANASEYYAPRRMGAAEVKNVDVRLANDRYTDHLYLSATDEATAEYQIGRDLVKMTMTATPSVPQIFALAYNTDLCMVSAPLTNDEAQVSIRLYAPANGEYTLSVSNDAAADVYLLHNGMPVWNLSESAYTLDLEKGNTEGYSLRLRRAHKQTTDMDAVNGSGESGVQKVIMDNQLYIIYDNQTFNAVGKMVK